MPSPTRVSSIKDLSPLGRSRLQGTDLLSPVAPRALGRSSGGLTDLLVLSLLSGPRKGEENKSALGKGRWLASQKEVCVQGPGPEGRGGQVMERYFTRRPEATIAGGAPGLVQRTWLCSFHL